MQQAIYTNQPQNWTAQRFIGLKLFSVSGTKLLDFLDLFEGFDGHQYASLFNLPFTIYEDVHGKHDNYGYEQEHYDVNIFKRNFNKISKQMSCVINWQDIKDELSNCDWKVSAGYIDEEGDEGSLQVVDLRRSVMNMLDDFDKGIIDLYNEEIGRVEARTINDCYFNLTK
jgi:hypothetical protein